VISATVQKIINIPTGMDNRVNSALSLFFTIDITPITNPTTPITARIGVGRGSLISMAKVDIFMDINTIKRRVKTAAHLPTVDLDQS
jgi:hypothetical protein